jgi:hypothetical protein
MACNGTTVPPPNDRCNDNGAAVDICELHNTVLREKMCHNDTCQPPVPRWTSCNYCRVLVVRNLSCATESTWILIKSFLLSTDQDQCPQDIESDTSETATVMKEMKNESQLFRTASIKIRNKVLKNHSRNSTITTFLTLYDKEFASLKSNLLSKSRFHIRWASLCFILCFEGKCFENPLLPYVLSCHYYWCLFANSFQNFVFRGLFGYAGANRKDN